MIVFFSFQNKTPPVRSTSKSICSFSEQMTGVLRFLRALVSTQGNSAECSRLARSPASLSSGIQMNCEFSALSWVVRPAGCSISTVQVNGAALGSDGLGLGPGPGPNSEPLQVCL